MKTWIEILAVPQPLTEDGKCYKCCYCEQEFAQLEQPLFLEEDRVAHFSCHKDEN
jgi:hypothetical protein